MSVSEPWSRAFARQACSDFEARDTLLDDSALPQCHQLHLLQMAMEKTAKAHLIDGGADPYSLQSSHKYIQAVVPVIVRDALGRTGSKPGWLMDAVRQFARRVELLHPQVDDGGRIPANCEYPWEDGAGRVLIPAEHDFGLNRYPEKAAVTTIKETRTRAQELAG